MFFSETRLSPASTSPYHAWIRRPLPFCSNRSELPNLLRILLFYISTGLTFEFVQAA